MQQKIAFIGCGNMGRAILNGLLNRQYTAPENMYIYTPTAANRAQLQQQYGITPAENAHQAVENADIVIVAVKPHLMLQTLQPLVASLSPHTLIVSVAAGITLAQLASVLGEQRKIIRAMPNTPAQVNAAMTSISPNVCVSEQETARILALFRCCGEAERLDESLIHAVIGASGSSPALICLFIEAMADAVVLGGMPRRQAYQFVAQALFGTAKMVLETGLHPGVLKDQVCSPAGTTIAGVKALEDGGMRAAVMNAVGKCIERSQQLSQS